MEPARRRGLKPLAAQVVVITGATSGVGLATARAAAERGAAVVLAARNAVALENLVEEIKAKGGHAVAIVADVGDEAQVRAIAAIADEAFGGFDTWVNNAGVSIYGKIEDTPVEDQRRLFETNYWGVVYGSLIAVERLKARKGGGAVINIGSVLSDVAIPTQGVYSASKHAVKGFTHALRMEVRKEDPSISITLIKPSALDTPYKEHARNYLDTPATNPPPVYAVSLVADAILYAAETPVRTLTVGGGGRALAILGQLFPAMVDPALAWATPFLSKDKPENHRRDSEALHRAGRDMRERAPYALVRETSYYTQAQMNPRVTAAALVAAVLGLWATLTVRRELHDARIRREVRRALLKPTPKPAPPPPRRR